MCESASNARAFGTRLENGGGVADAREAEYRTLPYQEESSGIRHDPCRGGRDTEAGSGRLTESEPRGVQ